jgi:hypothetical protein
MEKDLGVHVDEVLSFRTHVREVALMANKVLWSIKRTVSSRGKDVIIKLYSALVKAHLEYCNQALIIKTKAENRDARENPT